MSTHTAQPTRGSRQRTRSCATGLRCHRCDISYAAGGDDLRPARTAARAWTSSTTTSWPPSHFRELPRSERPAEHLALRGAAADRRRRSPGARRPALRLHAADPRRPARRRARDRQPLHEGRLLHAAEPLLQGPRRVDVDRPAAGAGQDRDRLRVDRQRRHGGRVAGREGGGRLLRLLPQPARGDEGPRLHGARRQGLPGRGQLRRSQPALPGSRGSDRHGVREHHAAPVLRRGRQDGRVRDRRAARLALARPHHHRRRRRHALLAAPQGPAGAATAGARRDRRHAHPHRPAERLQPDRQRDPRRGSRDPRRDARRRAPTRWRSARRATATW